MARGDVPGAECRSVGSIEHSSVAAELGSGVFLAFSEKRVRKLAYGKRCSDRTGFATVLAV